MKNKKLLAALCAALLLCASVPVAAHGGLFGDTATDEVSSGLAGEGDESSLAGDGESSSQASDEEDPSGLPLPEETEQGDEEVLAQEGEESTPASTPQTEPSARGAGMDSPMVPAALAMVYNETQLRDAVAACGDGDTVKLGGNITLTGTEPLRFVDISATLDGGGYTLYSEENYHLGASGNTPTDVVRLKDITLDGKTTSGGLVLSNITLEMDEKTAIKNCVDSGIRTHGEVTVKGGTIQNNRADDRGGGIYAQGTLVVDGTNFVGNEVAELHNTHALGGAVYAEVSAKIRNASFTGNISQHFGGAVYVPQGSADNRIDNCTFTRNQTVVSTFAGGAIAIAAGSLDTRVTNCTFSQNSAEYGGGIMAHDGVTVEDCRFVGNTATYGAGMYCNGSQQAYTATVNRTVFRDNVASYGGAVYIWRNASLAMQGCTMGGNMAYSGGSLYLLANAGHTATLYNCTIQDSTATAEGGAVVVRARNRLVMDGGSILRGKAGTKGGGLELRGSGTAQLTDTVVEGCVAASGGGIYLDAANYANLQTDRVRFGGNVATAGAYTYTDTQYETTYLANIRDTVSLSAPFALQGDAEHNRAYNNYDIAYTTTAGHLTPWEVRYLPNGGQGGTSVAVPHGDSHTVHSADAAGVGRSGYTFAGWNTAADGGGTSYAAGQDVEVYNHLELHAQWVKTVGGSSSSSQAGVLPSSGGTMPPAASHGSGGGGTSAVSSAVGSVPPQGGSSVAGTGSVPAGGTPSSRVAAPAVVQEQSKPPGSQVQEGGGEAVAPVVAVEADGGVLFGGLAVRDKWSLLNLLIAVLAALGAVLQAVLVLRGRRQGDAGGGEEEPGEENAQEENVRQKYSGRVFRLGAVLLGALDLLLFLLLENLGGTMVLINHWTPLIGAVCLLHLVAALAGHFARQKIAGGWK